MSSHLTDRSLMVDQDYAHHIQSEPLRQVGRWVIFPWPIALPEGFDRVSTPLLTPERLEVLCARCSEQEWPEPIPRPIPEPVEDEDLFAEEEPS